MNVLFWMLLMVACAFDFDQVLDTARNDQTRGVFNHFVRHSASHAPIAKPDRLDFGEYRFDFARDYVDTARSVARETGFRLRKRSNTRHNVTLDTDPIASSLFSVQPPQLAFGFRLLGHVSHALVRVSALSREIVLHRVACECPCVRARLLKPLTPSERGTADVVPGVGIVMPANTSWNIGVLFAPHALDDLACDVVLHWGDGQTWRLPVTGRAARSPFRIAPLVGAVVQRGSLWQPPVRLFNPFSTTLLIHELRTAGHGIHVMLPPGRAPNNASSLNDSVWAVPPHSWRTIGFVNVHTTELLRYSGFVAISSNMQPFLVPVSVNAVGRGVHPMPPSLALGRVMWPHGHRSAAIVIHNAANHDVKIVDIAMRVPTEVYSAVRLDADTKNPLLAPEGHSKVALKLTAAANTVCPLGAWNGTVRVTTNETSARYEHMDVAWSLEFVRGALTLAPESRSLWIGAKSSDVVRSPTVEEQAEGWGPLRDVVLQHSMQDALTLFNVTTPLPSHIRLFPQLADPQVVLPNRPFTVARVQVMRDPAVPLDLHLHSDLALFRVPLTLFKGELAVHQLPLVQHQSIDALVQVLASAPSLLRNQTLGDSSIVSLGRSGVAEHTMWVNVTNPELWAPVHIKAMSLYNASASMSLDQPMLTFLNPACQTQFSGLKPDQMIVDSREWRPLTLPALLPPQCTALMGVRVRATEPGPVSGVLRVTGEYGDVHDISLKVHVLKGSLKLSVVDVSVDDTDDDDGMVRDVELRSTFERDVQVRHMSLDDQHFELTPMQMVLRGQSDVNVVVSRIRVVQAPRGQSKMLGILKEIDKHLVEDLVEERVTTALDDDDDTHDVAEDAGEAELLGWDRALTPSNRHLRHAEALVRHAGVEAATLASGTVFDPQRHNSTHLHLRGTLVIDTDCLGENLTVSLDAMLRRRSLLRSSVVDLGRVHVGHLMSLYIHVRNWRAQHPVTAQLLVPRRMSESANGQVRVSDAVAAKRVILEPFASARLGPILVRLSDRGLLQARLRVRTNSSLAHGAFEEFLIQGDGGAGVLVLADMEQGSDVLFEYADSTLADACQNGSLAHVHKLVRRLPLLNDGDLPLEVTQITVDGESCESRDGFSVVDCEALPFSLAPHEERTLTIVFAAKFHDSVVSNKLLLRTATPTGSVVSASYVLRGRVPTTQLDACRAVLPLTVGEQRVRHVVMFVALLCVFWLTKGVFAHTLVCIRALQDRSDNTRSDVTADDEVVSFLTRSGRRFVASADDTSSSDDDLTLDEELLSDSTTTTNSRPPSSSLSHIASPLTTGGPSGSGRSSPASESSDDVPVQKPPPKRKDKTKRTRATSIEKVQVRAPSPPKELFEPLEFEAFTTDDRHVVDVTKTKKFSKATPASPTKKQDNQRKKTKAASKKSETKPPLIVNPPKQLRKKQSAPPRTTASRQSRSNAPPLIPHPVPARVVPPAVRTPLIARPDHAKPFATSSQPPLLQPKAVRAISPSAAHARAFQFPHRAASAGPLSTGHNTQYTVPAAVPVPTAPAAHVYSAPWTPFGAPPSPSKADPRAQDVRRSPAAVELEDALFALPAFFQEPQRPKPAPVTSLFQDGESGALWDKWGLSATPVQSGAPASTWNNTPLSSLDGSESGGDNSGSLADFLGAPRPEATEDKRKTQEASYDLFSASGGLFSSSLFEDPKEAK